MESKQLVVGASLCDSAVMDKEAEEIVVREHHSA
jgi:hypothetical protein